MAKRSKIKSYKFGLRSEALAAWFLRLKGYHIIAHRYKTKMGEIDLVARKGNILAVIEVKARGKKQDEVLHRRQQQRISRAATLLIAKRRDFASLALRFDVIMLVPWRIPRHIKNAWENNAL